MGPGTVNLKAMCIFENDGKILVSKGTDNVKNEKFYRLLGGHVELFETGEEGVRREIKEELGSEIEDLKLIDIFENIFTYRGEKYHEIDFLYSGKLANKELYEKNPIQVVEHTHEFEAEWVQVTDILKGDMPLYPKFDYRSVFAP